MFLHLGEFRRHRPGVRLVLNLRGRLTAGTHALESPRRIKIQPNDVAAYLLPSQMDDWMI